VGAAFCSVLRLGHNEQARSVMSGPLIMISVAANLEDKRGRTSREPCHPLLAG